MAFSMRYARYRLLLLGDVLVLMVSYLFAFLLRLEFTLPGSVMQGFLIMLPVFITVKLPLFFTFNMYRGMWRYTSLCDVYNIIRATCISAVLLFAINWLVPTIPGIPRSIFILDLGISAVILTGIRVGIRAYYFRIETREGSNEDAKRLLIVGAGDAGEQLLREIRHSRDLNYDVVGFLDDDEEKIGSQLRGVPVLSAINSMPDLPVSFDEILIAIPSAGSREMRRITDLCKRFGKPFRTVPGLGEIVNGKVEHHTVRDVCLTDVIGRQEVELDAVVVNAFLRDKRMLITGAGGSIGAELARRCLEFSPQGIMLLDNSEYNLFRIQREFQEFNSENDIIPVLADVRDRGMMERVFQRYMPQIVFHAAAYKHVPIQEHFPWQAIHTNVRGTKIVLELAETYHAERFILVSTDKAVRPSSVMGATKRLAELLVHGNGVRRQTKCMAVRFGNVIGSSGSVIPIFQEQIRRGGPVTVTHPEIRRYFMSITEAAQLILQAGALGKGGEIFMLDMGDPIKIDTVARALITLSGFEPDTDIPILYTGLRPGEKMCEELLADDEQQVPTMHSKILILESSDRTMGKDTLDHQLEELHTLVEIQDREGIMTKLEEIVPCYNRRNGLKTGLETAMII